MNITIAVPCKDGMMTSMLSGFINLLQGNVIGGHRFGFQYINEIAPVDYARNLLVKRFFEDEKSEALWFIDADMLPGPQTLSMLDVEGDIVIGRALMLQGDKPANRQLMLSAFRKFENGVFCDPPFDAQEPCEIAGGGAACMLIKRHVLEDPRMHVGNLDWEPWQRFRMQYGPGGMMTTGEDLDFCARARENGYRVMFDPRAAIGHRKAVDLNTVQALIVNAWQQGTVAAMSEDAAAASRAASQVTAK